MLSRLAFIQQTARRIVGRLALVQAGTIEYPRLTTAEIVLGMLEGSDD